MSRSRLQSQHLHRKQQLSSGLTHEKAWRQGLKLSQVSFTLQRCWEYLNLCSYSNTPCRCAESTALSCDWVTQGSKQATRPGKHNASLGQALSAPLSGPRYLTISGQGRQESAEGPPEWPEQFHTCDDSLCLSLPLRLLPLTLNLLLPFPLFLLLQCPWRMRVIYQAQLQLCSSTALGLAGIPYVIVQSLRKML